MFSSSYSNLPPLPHRIFLLLTVVWAGSLWTIGYMVAPTLFSVLPSRETAGMIAGHLFRTQAMVGITIGVLQLVLCNVLIRRGAARYRALRWIVLAMLICVLAGYFGVQTYMEGLKAKAQALNMAVSASPYKAEFGMLHGVSSVIYLVQSLLALVLVWRASAPRVSGE